MVRITALGVDGQDFTSQISGMSAKLDEAKKDQSAQVVLQKSDTDVLDNQAATLANKLVPEIRDRMVKRGTDGKKVNKAAWKSAITEYSRDYGRHGVADAIVHGYEKGYQQSGMDRKALVKEWTEFARKSNYDLLVVTAGDVAQVSVSPSKEPEKDFEIATIYFNDARFVKKESIVLNEGTKDEEVRDIYTHRETGKEYVQDAFDAFVTRYVHRALNKYDNTAVSEKKPEQGVSIKADPRKKKDTGDPWTDIAKKIPTMGEDGQTEEIRNHQRKKELQGGSPFVSFTTTERPIFGSSAKNFEGEHGVATVDLAQISKNKVFDTHTPEALKKIHNIEKPNPDLPFKEGDEHVERNAAARDAMRTREVVVAGDIPDRAIARVKVEGKEWVKSLDGTFKSEDQDFKEKTKLLCDLVLANMGVRLGPTVEDVD